MTKEFMLMMIENSFREAFPEGFIQTRVCTGVGTYLCVTIGLIKDLDRVSNRIRENDPMFHRFVIHIDNDVYEAVCTTGGLAVNPRQSYLAMTILKTGWRKTSGDSEKIIKAFTRFFKKLRIQVSGEKVNIFGGEKISDLL